MSDDDLLVRRYQAICCAKTYLDFVLNKIKYGQYTTCDTNKLVVLTQWVDILLRYENPSNATEEALNCLTEAEIDHILEQISKMTGCCFYPKQSPWVDVTTPASDYVPWEFNSPAGTDIQWNDNDTIDTNELV
jgi:hypothetical protein